MILWDISQNLADTAKKVACLQSREISTRVSGFVRGAVAATAEVYKKEGPADDMEEEVSRA